MTDHLHHHSITTPTNHPTTTTNHTPHTHPQTNPHHHTTSTTIHPTKPNPPADTPAPGVLGVTSPAAEVIR